MKKMTSYERLNNAFNFKPVDSLPFAPLCDNYFASGLPQQGHEHNLLKALRFIGCDILLRHCPYCEVEYKNIDVSTKAVGKESITTFHTKLGDISTQYYFENGALYTRKHYIDSIEDAKIMAYVAENTVYKERFDMFKDTVEELGSDGLATPTVNCSPLLDTVQILCGLENSTYFILDEQEVMENMFNSLHERNKKMYSLVAKLPGNDVVFTYEDTSTTLISREWMTEYATPALDEYADIIHGAGKKFITHMCGKLSGFSDEICSVKSDGIDSICPPTTGDVRIGEARRLFKNKVLIGGIEPAALVRNTQNEVMELLKKDLSDLPDKKGVILSTGDATPYGTDINLLKFISDFVKTNYTDIK